MDFGILTEITWQMALLGGLSLSLGWGIRGNFGHEIGAAIPGALAAMAVVLVSGRADWLPRIAYFAMFGALGWAFGGSMSYMHVVSYTHSKHSGTVLYGFANLFVIGFLWAAMGGAGTSLPAILSSENLNLFFVPLVAIFIGWVIQNAVVRLLSRVQAMQRHQSRLYWYDTDWLNVLVATVATLIVVLIRGRFDFATSFILHLTIGWYVAFLLLVNVLKLRMTPPRGDNWSGCVGLVAGVLVFCWRYSMGGIAFVTLATGFIGGIGFALGQLLKLMNIRTGLNTNWHSVMEQTQGFFHGIGLAVAMAFLASRAPVIDTAPLSPWTLVFAISFVLVALTYLNHRKATDAWVEQVKSLPKKFYGIHVSTRQSSIPAVGWFELFYIAIGAAIVWLLVVDLKQPLAFMPATWLGKGQLLYLIFMWWAVVFNFERALVGFAPQRIITEGVITLNAVICTVLLALGTQAVSMREVTSQAMPYTGWVLNTVIVGLIAMILTTLAEWLIKHAIYGRDQAPGSGISIRFGPNSTAIKAKPQADAKHP